MQFHPLSQFHFHINNALARHGYLATDAITANHFYSLGYSPIQAAERIADIIAAR